MRRNDDIRTKRRYRWLHHFVVTRRSFLHRLSRPSVSLLRVLVVVAIVIVPLFIGDTDGIQPTVAQAQSAGPQFGLPFIDE